MTRFPAIRPARCQEQRTLALLWLIVLASSAWSESLAQTSPVVASLGAPLEVKVKDLDELVKQAGDRPLGLFLDDVWIPDIPAEIIVSSGVPSSQVRFLLVRSTTNRAAWGRLLGRPGARKEQVPSAVGTQDRKVVTAGPQVELKLLPAAQGKIVLIAAILFVLAAVAVLFRWNGMLRDYVPNSVKGPFSLGRVQMAFWFFNIALAFFVIWAATGASDTITVQLLALMGISSWTALGSVVISSNKNEQAHNAVKTAASELAAAPTSQMAKNSLTDAQAMATPPHSTGILDDLLTDANGYSLHRVQMLIWTLVLGALFWASVWHDLAMPEFSETLLALMGISAGTYLGFKIPEKQS